MTQSLEEVRFRVIETPQPDTENLASQIYATYVAPASEDTSVLPDGAPSEPEDRVRAEGKGAPPIAAHASGATITDEEAALLQETLQGKLNSNELQALLALMQGATPAENEDAPVGSRLPPLPARTVNRYRLGALVVLLILLGIGSSLLLNRPQGKGLVLPNAPTDVATIGAAAPATPIVAQAPLPQLDATLTSRNVALDMALKESEGQREALDLARRDYLLAQADGEMKKNGTPVEVWLIRRLGGQTLELRRALGKGGQFSGQAQQIATARALVGDARAVLLALQAEWQNPNAAPGRNRVAPAILAKQMNELTELARLVREASYEQQLRDEERVQQAAPDKKSGKHGQTKQREVTNGVLPSL
jgi:hypothetical protein